jgi:hypothetical protein
MVFNATFNNISLISWWSVLLVEETGGPGENHQTCDGVKPFNEITMNVPSGTSTVAFKRQF